MMDPRIKELVEQAYVADSLEENPRYKKSFLTDRLLDNMAGFHEKLVMLVVHDFLNELTNDDALGPARVETIDRLARKWGIEKPKA